MQPTERAVALGAAVVVAAASLVTGAYVRTANVEARGRVERACAKVHAAQPEIAGSITRLWTKIGDPEDRAIIASFAEERRPSKGIRDAKPSWT